LASTAFKFDETDAAIRTKGKRYEIAFAKKEILINDFVIDNKMTWYHRKFYVYRDKALWIDNEEGLENMARHILRASLHSKRRLNNCHNEYRKNPPH
jgi:hypothetical protein